MKTRFPSYRFHCRSRLSAIPLLAGLGLLIGGTAFAQQSPPPNRGDVSTHSGEVTSAGGGKLTMTIDGQNSHTHDVAKDAQISINGEAVRLEDLRRGDRIRVTTPKGKASPALVIEATRAAVENREARRPQNNRAAAEAAEETPVTDAPHVQHRPPQFGATVVASPGDGLLIQEIDPRSPAARAGLRPGDYILAVGQTNVISPEQFRELMANQAEGTLAEVTTWRGGKRRTVEIDLTPPRPEENAAAEATGGAWLGVLLRGPEDADRGVMITRIYPGGPASRAGLRAGDILLRMAGEEVASPDDVTEILQKLEAGSRTEVELSRNDVASKIEVRLGDASVFLQDEGQEPPRGRGEEQLFEEIPEHAMMIEHNRRLAEQNERLERLLLRVLDEVQTLREDLGQKPRTAERPPRGEQPDLERSETVPPPEKATRERPPRP